MSTAVKPSAVEVGIFVPQVAMDRNALLARAELVERSGFRSLWLYDHLYSPGQPDRDSFEAWTTATYLLARTGRLRVGHLVLDNNLRHPALLAKMASTLDVLSEGRFEIGIGSGSVGEEHDRIGLEWGTAPVRGRRLEESLEILTRMLGGTVTTFSGTHYRVHDLPNLPGPVQRPRPPIHVGGIGARFTLPLVARFADGWNVPTYGLAGWRESRRRLDEACVAIGRDPSTIGTSLQAVVAIAGDDRALASVRAEATRRYGAVGWGLEAGGLVGTPPMIVDRLLELVGSGVSRFVLLPHDRDDRSLGLLADTVLPELP
ncbi:MAG: LLM class flavin-dependent oxidoreductase [Acidimicrobiales bacterium]